MSIRSIAMNLALSSLIAGYANSAPTVINSGFEDPQVGANDLAAFQYNPNAPGWTFNRWSGITGAGSGFTLGLPPAPEGVQVAFLQGYHGENGRIDQSLSVESDGVYTISFWMIGRIGSPNNFSVQFDDASIGTYQAVAGLYLPISITPGSVSSGSHKLSFVSLNTAGEDHTVFLDDVKFLPVATVPEPTTATLISLGLGIVGIAATRARASLP